MTKTKTELVVEAHRRIAVLSVDEDPSTDMATYGAAQADALFAELLAVPHSMPFTWDLDTIPDAVYRPLAWLLAVPLAAHYQVPPRDTEARAMGRVRAYAFTDDREDRRDIDEDGIITEAEAEAGLRATYY